MKLEFPVHLLSISKGSFTPKRFVGTCFGLSHLCTTTCIGFGHLCSTWSTVCVDLSKDTAYN